MVFWARHTFQLRTMNETVLHSHSPLVNFEGEIGHFFDWRRGKKLLIFLGKYVYAPDKGLETAEATTSVQLCIPAERAPLSGDPIHQINTFRSFLNVLGDPSVSWISRQHWFFFSFSQCFNMLKTSSVSYKNAAFFSSMLCSLCTAEEQSQQAAIKVRLRLRLRMMTNGPMRAE